MLSSFKKIMLIFLTLMLIGLLSQTIWAFRSVKTLEKKITKLIEKSPERDCEVVNGEEHIYKDQCLSKNYQPKMLTRLSPRGCFLDTVQYLDVRAKIAVENLIQGAQEEGLCLVVTSGYRSKKEQQEEIKKTTAKSSGSTDKFAKPGRSEHQTGLAVDFAGCPMKNGKRDDSVERPELKKDFRKLPEFKWLKENAHKYGFEQSYRKDNQEKTGYPPEAWHWKLVIP